MSLVRMVGLVCAASVLAACGDRARPAQEGEPDLEMPVERVEDMQPAVRGMPAVDGRPAGVLGDTLEAEFAGTVVNVTVDEWSVGLSRESIPAGPTQLVFENRGSRPHRMEVRSQHFGRWTTVPIPPGGSVSLGMPLAYTTYEVFCNMEDGDGSHRERGMLARLRVE
jgi:hypothetical protein